MRDFCCSCCFCCYSKIVIRLCVLAQQSSATFIEASVLHAKRQIIIIGDMILCILNKPPLIWICISKRSSCDHAKCFGYSNQTFFFVPISPFVQQQQTLHWLWQQFHSSRHMQVMCAPCWLFNSVRFHSWAEKIARQMAKKHSHRLESDGHWEYRKKITYPLHGEAEKCQSSLFDY